MATISHITLPDGTDYSIQATGIFYGEVDSTSTSTVFTATIPGITEYYDGLTILLKNGVVTSAANFTININDLGAKGSYSNQATGNPITPTNPTRDTTIFNINYTMMFIYCSTLVSGGCWIGYRGYNSDTNTIAYQVRTNSTALKTTDRTRYYRILFSSADGTKWVPANTQYDNSATSTKTVNTRKINPFGRIVYLGNSTNYAADAVVAATALWHQYALALGYSFNRTGSALTLTSTKPVYVKCAPQTDGSAIMDSTTPIVQDLPSTEDGKIYIFLGMAYSATNIEMFYEHPVYYYKDGCIRIWTNAPTVSVPTASDANPQMDGTAAAGTSNNYSRADHVHPSDTTKLTKSLSGTDSTSGATYSQNFSNTQYGLSLGVTTFLNNLYTTTSLVNKIDANGNPYIQIASKYEEDPPECKIVVEPSGITIRGLKTPTSSNDAATKGYVDGLIPAPYASNPAMDGTASAGSSSNYAKGDHVHPTDTSRMAANLKGAANGVAELDSNSKVPVAQIPDDFDEVVFGKYENQNFYVDTGSPNPSPITPRRGVIYADRYFTEYSDGSTAIGCFGTGKLYTYGMRGIQEGYSELAISLTLGETSSTAYRGDRGKTAYDHSQLTSGNPHNVSKSDIGLGNVDNVQQYSASNPPPYPVTSVNGSTGAVTLTIPTKVSDLTNDTGFITGMYIASYGTSTFAEVEEAYTASKIVYCKASSNANPATGTQGRMAFLAYVNINSNNNTVNEFEFQYYRSVSTHTDAQQGDQVFIYKLNRNTGWSVTTREASSKVAANNGLTTSYSSGTITVSHANSAITAQSTQAVYPIAIDAYGHITGYGSAVTIPEIPSVTASDNGKILTVVNGAWAAAELPIYEGSVMDNANSRLW